MVLNDPEIIQEFLTESTEHLADIERQLLDIEAGGAAIDVDLVNTVFRSVHSIKGAAGFMGFDTVQALAHSLESVLNMMRECSLVPTPETMDIMLRAADLLRQLIDDIDNSNEVDISDFVRPLDAIATGKSKTTGESEAEATAPTNAAGEPDSAETSKAETEVKAEQPAMVAEKDTQKSRPAPQQASPSKSSPKAGDATGDAAPAPRAPSAEANIRVSVDVLDNLMNLAGELVLGRNQLVQSVQSEDKTGLDNVSTRIDQITSELQEAIMKTRMQPIGNVFNKFARVVRDLSNRLEKQCNLQIEGKDVEVDKTIIEAIGDPLTHLVRNSVDHGIETPDIRESQGKPAAGTIRLQAYHQSGKVRVEIADDGKGIDVDVLKAKAVSKNLLTKDGVDTMSDREAVRLIFHPGFSTAEEVTDVSGRGVGMDVVRSNIEQLGGTVEIETQLNVGTTIIVTLPLTLAIIPSLIVESGAQRFAIPQVNIVELVRIRDQEHKTRIGHIKNKEVLRLRGSLLPLVRLHEALEGEPIAAVENDSELNASNVRNIIVVESGTLCYGVVVDDLFDSEEIVVKPLGRHLKDCPCLSGATILGDGQVALILDVAGIAQQTNLRIAEEDQKSDGVSEHNATSNDATQSVLLFTNDANEQFAVLMEAVARIERIRTDQIDSVGGRELLQYGGGTLTLLKLEDLVGAKPRVDSDRLYVIVVEAANREVGLIAPELVDIRDVTTDFDEKTFQDACVIGSYVINDRTTRLLDTIQLAKKARPDWFATHQTEPPRRPAAMTLEPPATGWSAFDANTSDTNKPGESTPEQTTILLAEDSSFFRRQVKGFLEAGGFQVVDCEDGRDAWKTLAAEPSRFQLVLTDIEMPNMDGLELARKIRSENQFADLPIVALTSLASHEDVQRGYDAGICEYQVKLDRDELMAAVERLASAAVAVGV